MIDSIPIWLPVIAWVVLAVVKFRGMHAGNKELS